MHKFRGELIRSKYSFPFLGVVLEPLSYDLLSRQESFVCESGLVTGDQ